MVGLEAYAEQAIRCDLYAVTNPTSAIFQVFICFFAMPTDSARTQSYADFNSSETDSKAEHVLYDALAQKHIEAWDDRDKRWFLTPSSRSVTG
jgi:hypothetical protein